MKFFTLLPILLLFITVGHAQNYKLIEEMKHVADKERATAIAEELVSVTPKKYRLIFAKESVNAGILRFRFVPNEITDADLENKKFTEQQRASFITIDFSFFNAGEDKNAVRPAFITYKLNEINCAYPELFAIWKNFFRGDVESEITLTDFKSQHLKEPEKKIDIYIYQTEEGWALRNMSIN